MYQLFAREAQRCKTASPVVESTPLLCLREGKNDYRNRGQPQTIASLEGIQKCLLQTRASKARNLGNNIPESTIVDRKNVPIRHLFGGISSASLGQGDQG